LTLFYNVCPTFFRRISLKIYRVGAWNYFVFSRLTHKAERFRNMRVLPVITDPGFVKPENRSSLDRFFIKLLRDERDLPFVHLSLQITFSLLPLAVILYLPVVGGWYWAIAAIAYQYLNNFVFKGSFGLMLHCTSHRILFKK